MGTVYKAASAVMSAIDGLAAILTGDRKYFWEKGHNGIERRAEATGEPFGRGMMGVTYFVALLFVVSGEAQERRRSPPRDG